MEMIKKFLKMDCIRMEVFKNPHRSKGARYAPEMMQSLCNEEKEVLLKNVFQKSEFSIVVKGPSYRTKFCETRAHPMRKYAEISTSPELPRSSLEPLRTAPAILRATQDPGSSQKV